MDSLSPALVGTREALTAQFGERLVFAPPHRGELSVEVAGDDLHEVLGWLREQLGYRMLVDLTAVDRLGTAVPRFAVCYLVFCLETSARLRLKVLVDEGEPVPSITPLWKGANFFEREVYDLFGIPFAGHPQLERILTPDGFEGHPLRKDFAIGDEPVTFDIPHRKRFQDA